MRSDLVLAELLGGRSGRSPSILQARPTSSYEFWLNNDDDNCGIHGCCMLLMLLLLPVVSCGFTVYPVHVHYFHPCLVLWLKMAQDRNRCALAGARRSRRVFGWLLFALRLPHCSVETRRWFPPICLPHSFSWEHVVCFLSFALGLP